MAARRFQIGCDIGGTFTDVVVVSDEGQIWSDKADTTPADLSVGMVAALESAAGQIEIPLDDLLGSTTRFVNGTTIVTNSIATLTGSKVGLITTAGHGDMLRIARSARNAHRDHHRQVNIPQIVPRRRVAEVEERIDKKGAVIVPLREDDARRAIAELVGQGVDSIAVSLLWGFANPVHEQAIAALLEREHPDLYVSLASEIHPVMREYERTMTTVLNSFTGLRVAEYTERIERELKARGLAVPISFMQGFGGTISAREARRKPIALVDSGPAGGVVGAAALGGELGEQDLIAADMGGTSFDVSVLPDREINVTRRVMLGEHFLTGLEKIEVKPVGAGGGSLGWVDLRGLPRVGPASAGADPGPAAYDQGGLEPTVTDAAIQLGIIDPEQFLGGRRTLDPQLAEAALARLGEQLGLDADEAAAAIYRLVTAEMAGAAREVTVERGHDPRKFALVAFGGALGIFGADIARSLGIPRVLIPAEAPVFSAYGLLATDDVRVGVRSGIWAGGDAGHIEEAFRSLEADARRQLRDASYADDQIEVEWQGDFKFAGQLWELTIPVERTDARIEESLGLIVSRFPQLYESEYGPGTAWEDTPVMLVAVRVVARATPERFEPASADLGRDIEPTPSGARRILRPIEEAGAGDAAIEASVYADDALVPGATVSGPAIIVGPLTTVQVPPGWTLSVDGRRNLVMQDRHADLHSIESDTPREVTV